MRYIAVFLLALVCIGQSQVLRFSDRQNVLTGGRHEAHPDAPPQAYADAKYPTPNSDILTWSRQELGMLIHFNMATFIDEDGCNYDPNVVPPISSFTPYSINTDQWAQTIQDFGATYAVLVAKHNCGFTIWPTNVAFPEANFQYNYSIANSPVSGYDVVGSFIKSCAARGIRTGFYYSVVVNNWLNVQNGQVQPNPSPLQANITQDLYNKIVMAQLTELWSTYGGPNGLQEIWFDGGYTAGLASNITSLLNSTQPHASVFGGYGVSSNPVRWIGTEWGVAPDPTWSTGTSADGGDPNSPVWCPAECDTTLQENDRWFWGANVTLRPVDSMIKVYHETVGHNCQLMLDLTPDRSGLIPPNYAESYKQLGDFIRSCYGTPVVNTNGTGLQYYLEIWPDQHHNDPFTIDRVVIQENQAYGQRVRAYSVDAYPVGGNEWVHLVDGTSIGNKKIDIFSSPMNVYAVRLTISSSVDAPVISNFSGHLC